jgi:multimeric flavodoxin WrbA
MQKTIVILGSPRKKGNSTLLAHKAIEGITAMNGLYDVIYLNGMNIRPCQGCDSCRRDDKRTCILKDDMQLLYPKLTEANSLLIASPIYMFSVTAQLKLFMDRCYACPQALAGKKIGILLTYGEPDAKASGVMNAIQTLKDEYSYANSKILGILYGSADKMGEITANELLMEQAYELGELLAV